MKVGNLTEAGQQRASNLLASTSRILYNYIATLLTSVLILAISIFLYGTFYYAYMPLEVHEEPVNLQFEACMDSKGLCSYPNASVDIGQNIRLMAGQPYSITLVLDVPDSFNNQELGMFMSCMHVMGKSKKLLHSSCKSASLEFRSDLLRTLETVVYSPMLLIGTSSQKQRIHIQYFRRYLDDTFDPAAKAVLEIKSKFIQVYSSRLIVHAEFSGLRHIMYHHPWMSTTAGVLSNVVLLTMVVLISWTRFFTEDEITLDPRLSRSSSGLTGSVYAGGEGTDDIDRIKAEAKKRMEIQDD